MLIERDSFGSLKGKCHTKTPARTHEHACTHTCTHRRSNPSLSLLSIVWLRLLSPGVTASRWLALSCQSQLGPTHTHAHTCPIALRAYVQFLLSCGSIGAVMCCWYCLCLQTYFFILLVFFPHTIKLLWLWSCSATGVPHDPSRYNDSVI